MCGITGIFDLRERRAINRQTLVAMTQAIAHRGPDGDGYHIEPGIALGHRRLAIIDLHTGDQPLYSADGTQCIVFNGEIYNFLALRAELERRGHGFRTRSDTEVILAAWREWGESCVERLRGMFAFALWDRGADSLFIARDRLGKKPLYYAELDNGFLIFASELKALLTQEHLPRRIDPRAIEDYFAYGYVPEERAIYADVRKLPPASTLLLRRGRGLPAPRRYWRPRFDVEPGWTPASAGEALIDSLDTAVDIRRISDVPLGAFLSGGVDSSAVVALMAGQSEQPVKTFSIGFRQAGYDESAYARAHAARYGTDHHERIVDTDEFDLVDRLATVFDEPFGDSSAIPTFRVSAIAREQVTVILSGDGGDEVFAGYRRYLWHRTEERLRGRIPAPLRAALFGGLARAYPKLDWAPRMFRAKTTLQELALDTRAGYFVNICRLNDATRDGLYSDGLRRQLDGYHAIDILHRHFDDADTDDPLSQAQYVDLMTWLPGDILTKVDRTSMANSLETRAPLLDHVFIDRMGTLPSALKLAGREGKAIFKSALRPLVSDDILYRAKMGFSVPLAAWFRGPLRQRVRDAVTGEHLGDSGYFDMTHLRGMVDAHQAGQRDYSAELWSVLMFDGFLRRVHDCRPNAAASPKASTEASIADSAGGAVATA